MSLADFSSGVCDDQRESTAGGSQWLQCLNLFELHCQRVLRAGGCEDTATTSDGILKSATFKKAAALSKWIYIAAQCRESTASGVQYSHPHSDELDNVCTVINGGKQIAQFALFVAKRSAKVTDGYLVFKGTEKGKIFDLIADVCAIPFPIAGSRQLGVHCGMYSTMQRDFLLIRKLVADYCTRIGTLYLCGHSLGGGLAACFLFHSLLTDWPLPKLELITFGSPSVLSLDFAVDSIESLMRFDIEQKEEEASSRRPVDCESAVECTTHLVDGETVASGLSKLSAETRAVVEKFAAVSHHVVNRFDIVPRIPSSVPWIKGLIPYCFQQIFAESVAKKLHLSKMLLPTVRESLVGVLSRVRQHAESFGPLLSNYRPLGRFFFFIRGDRYYHCHEPELVRAILQFTPPVKVRCPRTKETLNVMMQCMDQRLLEYGTDAEKRLLLEADFQMVALIALQSAECTKEETEAKRIIERQRAVQRHAKLHCIDADLARLKFVIVEDKDKAKAGFSKLKLSTKAWIRLKKCHSMNEYLKLFGVKAHEPKSGASLLKVPSAELKDDETEELLGVVLDDTSEGSEATAAHRPTAHLRVSASVPLADGSEVTVIKEKSASSKSKSKRRSSARFFKKAASKFAKGGKMLSATLSATPPPRSADEDGSAFVLDVPATASADAKECEDDDGYQLTRSTATFTHM